MRKPEGLNFSYIRGETLTSGRDLTGRHDPLIAAPGLASCQTPRILLNCLICQLFTLSLNCVKLKSNLDENVDLILRQGLASKKARQYGCWKDFNPAHHSPINWMVWRWTIIRSYELDCSTVDTAICLSTSWVLGSENQSKQRHSKITKSD